MARIRSVHPGLFTDEAFIQLSDAAQIFFIGLWTEADDQGVFEWKPATLKLRLRGASTQPVEPLLEELAGLDCVRQYEIDGRKLGVIRNFQRFQRPKKPNRLHLLPPEFRTYVCSTVPSSEPEPVEEASVPPKAEMSPQMEDGGWREGEKKESAPRKARGTRLREDWTPQGGAPFARSLGLDPTAVLAKFRDYWIAQPGQKGVKLDWEATFRNWCRNEAERKPPKARRADDNQYDMTGTF